MAAEERGEKPQGHAEELGRADGKDKAEDGETMSKASKQSRMAWQALMTVSALAVAYAGARVLIGAALGWAERAAGFDDGWPDDEPDEPKQGPSMFRSMYERFDT